MPLFMLPRLGRKLRNRKEKTSRFSRSYLTISPPLLFSFALLYLCNISFFYASYHCLLLPEVQRQPAFIKERQYWLIYNIVSTFFDQSSMHISSFEKHFMNHWAVWKIYSVSSLLCWLLNVFHWLCLRCKNAALSLRKKRLKFHVYINNKTARGGDTSVMYLISYVPLTAPLSINPHKLLSYSSLFSTFSLIFLAGQSKNTYFSPPEMWRSQPSSQMSLARGPGQAIFCSTLVIMV